MQINFLEELVAEWYEYQGCLVRRNERVGRNPDGKGGYAAELDVVAFNPKTRDLHHVETSTDSCSWPTREEKFRKKFAFGDEYIGSLFDGLELPQEVDKTVVLAYGSDRKHKTVGGGRVQMVEDLLATILRDLKNAPFSSRAVPEKYPILRVLQMVVHHRARIVDELRQV